MVRTTSPQSDTLGPKLDSNSLSMMHIEMEPAGAAASSSTEMLEMFPRGLIPMEHAVPLCAEKGETHIFHKQSMENLRKS